MGKIVTLAKAPSVGPAYLKIIRTDYLTRARKAGSSAGATIPDTVVAVDNVTIDRGRLAQYVRATGLRLTEEVPATYAFVLAQPSFMTLFADQNFPFAPMGLVHTENLIRQERPVAPGETFNIRTSVGDLREHRKGLLFDTTSEIRAGNELVWTQKATMLKPQRTSLSDQPAPEPPAQKKLPPPAAYLSVGQSQIWDYAVAGGDFNPIHISGPTAKALGFPKAIAHGMWEAAAALRYAEGNIPPAHRYNARFGRPAYLPNKMAVSLRKEPKKISVDLRDPKTGAPHLQGTITPNA